MRLWSLHPSLLDRQGLVACWREALLAQAVLLGRTEGYTRHPQLARFRAHRQPAAALAGFLQVLWEDSRRRGYRFDATRIATALPQGIENLEKIPVSTGQLNFEWQHLLTKLADRSPAAHARAVQLQQPWVHPLFTLTPGEVALWERGSGTVSAGSQQ